MTLPLLTQGIEFEVTDEWPMVTTREVLLPLSAWFAGQYILCKGDRVLGVVSGRYLAIAPRYACDGYSPVRRRPRWWPGSDPWIRFTPTPKCGLAPALGHDILRQFADLPGSPWGRDYSDTEFYNWLAMGGVSRPVAGLYHQAVAGVAGDIYIAATRKVDPELHIIFEP